MLLREGNSEGSCSSDFDYDSIVEVSEEDSKLEIVGANTALETVPFGNYDAFDLVEIEDKD